MQVTGSGASLDFCDEDICTLIPSTEVECWLDPCGDHTFFGLPTVSRSLVVPAIRSVCTLARHAREVACSPRYP